MQTWPKPGPSHDPLPLTEEHLRAILKVQGRFPDKYRPICWRYLLALPNDTKTYSETCTGVTEPVAKLLELYPISDTRLRNRLTRVLTSIDRQSHALRSSLPAWLPALVFPFLQVFGPDQCASTEAVLTVLANWFPMDVLPPVWLIAELDRVSLALLPGLSRPPSSSTEPVAGGPGYRAWGVLQSAGSSHVDDWPMLMDHVLVEPVQFMYLVSLSIVERMSKSRAARPVFSSKDIIKRARQLKSRYIEEINGKLSSITPLSSIPAPIPSHLDERRVIEE